MCVGLLTRSPIPGAHVASMLILEVTPWWAFAVVPPPLVDHIIRIVCDELHHVSLGSGRGGKSPLAAAGCPVPPRKLLEWVEQAINLRRRGGEDYLSGPTANSLGPALRTLSASADPGLGVEAARMFALMGGSFRAAAQERLGCSPGDGGSTRSPGLGLAKLARSISSPNVTGQPPMKPSSREAERRHTIARDAAYGAPADADDRVWRSVWRKEQVEREAVASGGARERLEAARLARLERQAQQKPVTMAAWLD